MTLLRDGQMEGQCYFQQLRWGSTLQLTSQSKLSQTFPAEFLSSLPWGMQNVFNNSTLIALTVPEAAVLGFSKQGRHVSQTRLHLNLTNKPAAVDYLHFESFCLLAEKPGESSLGQLTSFTKWFPPHTWCFWVRKGKAGRDRRQGKLSSELGQPKHWIISSPLIY